MDTIADLLTRIRNSNISGKEKVDVPYSKIKEQIVKILKEEGYILGYKPVHAEGKKGVLRILLKYQENGEKVITGISRVSKSGRRVYSSYSDIPKVRGPFGISILSTSKGLMTDKQAKKEKTGGEVLCQGW